jgi:hypothetical protein
VVIAPILFFASSRWKTAREAPAFSFWSAEKA